MVPYNIPFFMRLLLLIMVLMVRAAMMNQRHQVIQPCHLHVRYLGIRTNTSNALSMSIQLHLGIVHNGNGVLESD